jgi:2-dehydropantoate 2-reductase
MRICFFGVGGVGGYFGAIVAERFKNVHDIYFIARGAHKDAICANGLTLKKAGGEEQINVSPKKCTETVSGLPICDLIILSVKGYDLENAVKEISKIANEKTVILPLLNGVDIYEKIKKNLHQGIVLPSCVYIGTHIESPGVIYQKGGNCRIFIGADPGIPDFYPEMVLTLLKESNIDFSWEENVKIAIWTKYMFIAAFGLITATYDKTLGEISDDFELSQTTISIMHEIGEIAQILNIPLDSDIEETTFLRARQFPYDTKTSFQRDVESKGKVNEGDSFGGTIIRLGEELKIPVPATKFVYEKLLRKFVTPGARL